MRLPTTAETRELQEGWSEWFQTAALTLLAFPVLAWATLLWAARRVQWRPTRRAVHA